MVSRHFFEAASRLDEWQLTTVPAFSMTASERKDDRNTPSRAWRAHAKQFIPRSIRKNIRSFLSPASRVPITPHLYTRRMAQQIQKTIQQHPPFDVLLLHTSQQDLEALARLCRQTDTPIVLRAPGPFAYQADHVFHRYMSQRDRLNESFLHQAAAAIAVISEDMKHLFIQSGVDAGKLHVIPNGIDFAAFTPGTADGKSIRKKHGLNNRQVVGYVGGFWPGNDMGTLLQAWQQIETAQPEAVLLLVGDGPQRTNIEKLSLKMGLKHCIWVGHIPHSAVADYLSVMDIGIGPYTKEALAFVSPLKVIEYAAMGLPVVAAGGGQIKDLIEHGVTGCTYEPGSPDDLAKCVLNLLHKPEQAKKMGEIARSRLQNGWNSWDKVAVNVMSICRSVAQ